MTVIDFYNIRIWKTETVMVMGGKYSTTVEITIGRMNLTALPKALEEITSQGYHIRSITHTDFEKDLDL